MAFYARKILLLFLQRHGLFCRVAWGFRAGLRECDNLGINWNRLEKETGRSVRFHDWLVGLLKSVLKHLRRLAKASALLLGIKTAEMLASFTGVIHKLLKSVKSDHE